MKERLKYKSKDLLGSLSIFITVLLIGYLCIFKIDCKNNPTNILFLITGIVLIIMPSCYSVVQKIQLYSIKKRFIDDEYIICESVNRYPKWLLYVLAPAFIGINIGCVATVLPHPEVQFRRINNDNIIFAIIVVICLLYFFYYLVLRIKTVLTNQGLRSNYKHDTLFLQVENIQEETVGNVKILKIYKNPDKQIKIAKIPKIYKPANDLIDSVTGSIIQNYEEIKTSILRAYEVYKNEEKINDYQCNNYNLTAV